MFYQILLKIYSKKTILSILILFFASFFSFAQPSQSSSQKPELKEDWKKEELTKFIKANKEVTVVQQNNEQKIMNAIEEGGMDVATFNKILTAKQQQKKAEGASEDDLKKFNVVVNDVIKIQQKMQSKMNQAIKNSGLEVDKYDQIMYAYQNSNTVKQEINQLVQQNKK